MNPQKLRFGILDLKLQNRLYGRRTDSSHFLILTIYRKIQSLLSVTSKSPSEEFSIVESKPFKHTATTVLYSKLGIQAVRYPVYHIIDTVMGTGAFDRANLSS